MSDPAAENPSEITGEEEKPLEIDDPVIAQEMRRLGLVGNMGALIMKPYVEEEFGITDQVIYLPMGFMSQAFLVKGGLDTELLAVALDETIKRLRPHGPTKLLASSLLSRARALRDREDKETILSLVLEAVAIYEKLGNSGDLGRAFIELGTVLRDGGLLYDALSAYEKAYGLLAPNGDRAGVAAILYHRGHICRSLGLYEEALQTLGEAQQNLSAITRVESWPLAIASEVINCYAQIGDDAAAMQALDKWIPLVSNAKSAPYGMHPYAFVQRARLRWKAGDEGGAIADYVHAADYAYQETLQNYTLRFRSGMRSELDYVYQEGLSAALKANRPEIAFGILERSKSVSGGVSHLPTAVRRNIEPCARFDCKKGSLGSTNRFCYGLNLFEHRCRMTLEESSLAKEELLHFEAEVTSLVKQAWSAVLQMNKEQMRICQEQAEWLLAQRDILIARKQAKLAGLPMLESLAAQVQDAIPKNALVLEYTLVEDSVWVLALSRVTLKSYRTGLSRFGAEMLAESFRYECDGVLPTHALNRLGHDLLMPIEDQLHDFSMVIVILPRELFGLPFHAMWAGSAPLIETHEVLYLPSASFLTQPAKDRSLHDITAESSCIVLSVPSVSYVAVKALHDAYEEATMVSSLFRSPSLLKDAQASSDRLLNLPEGTQILHLACHAQFEREYPLLGRMLLADRPVFAFEIMMANLNLDLANLSACQTAAARAYLGGETEGLTSAFAAAGARTVLASSWPMDDSAGYEFTSTFYQQLLGEQIRSPWSAARVGQRMLKDRPDTSHPYFWAPFVVVGTPSLENYE